ncbi:DUF6161 domain-containing protein [Clostridium magnum]|uniref:DUF6161 domain-containing protein n=1 Tax=Clostridium magnum TaxID=33954 RepID=UPI00091E8625|nr:DUF6161 domain-containing protein [Clostridium magnum]SHJ12711.1 hypothetical protein SAMN02745944_05396 [Clostridium magnum DSM 2767]
MEFSEHAKEYFKTQNVEITIYPEDVIRCFEDLEIFYDFVKKECDYWQPCTQGRASEIRNHFLVVLNYLNNINTYAHDLNQVNSSIIYAINSIKANRFPAVFSITSKGKLIKEMYERSYEISNAFCDYLFDNRMNWNNNLGYFKGLMYAFSINDSEIALTVENEAERNSLIDLHSEYNEKIEKLHSKHIEKNKELDNSVASFQNNVNELFVKIESDGKKLLDDNENELASLKNKLNDLENLYKEKLALAAPADYWKKLSTSYKKWGGIWTGASIGLSCIMVGLLMYILYNLPKVLTETNNKITYDNIRGTIIFALIVSIGVYAINLFVKLALSAYHLSRDAKEREQLTYVYLSLINEKAIETSERSIVLQSIFSRADTGLLKGDSSPTLPDGILSQVLKNIGGK